MWRDKRRKNRRTGREKGEGKGKRSRSRRERRLTCTVSKAPNVAEKPFLSLNAVNKCHAFLAIAADAYLGLVNLIIRQRVRRRGRREEEGGGAERRGRVDVRGDTVA